MLLPILTLVAALAAARQIPDSIVIPSGELMRLYTDCSEARWPFGTEERFVPKTAGEIDSGVVRRRALEAAWRAWFTVRGGDSIQPTDTGAWRYPLAVRGRLLDNFRSPRPGGIHAALDIFVPSEGVLVRSPVAGVVVAAGDGWRGGYERRGRGFYYEGDGLSRRAGNGVIVFDPAGGGYFLFSHLRDGVLVRAGDLVRAGTPLGRVGHTGNAARPRGGKHLHFAYKRPGLGCGYEGVLVPVDPFRLLRDARGRDFPLPSAPRHPVVTPAGGPPATP